MPLGIQIIFFGAVLDMDLLLHDTHAHLDLLLAKTYPCLNDNKTLLVLDQLLEKHEFIIQATTNVDNYYHVVKTFQNHPKIWYLLGLHPETIKEETDITTTLYQQQQGIQQARNNAKVIGLGEIGLDYYWSQDIAVHKKQQWLFEEQLTFAEQYQLPVCVHLRDAKNETQCIEDGITLLKKHPSIRFVVHCFTGTQAQADTFLSMGGYLGFGGIITYNSGKELLQIAKSCPQDRLLLETDLPFLSPTPYRGKDCMPYFIHATIEHLAHATSISPDSLLSQARSNAKSLFGI